MKIKPHKLLLPALMLAGLCSYAQGGNREPHTPSDRINGGNRETWQPKVKKYREACYQDVSIYSVFRDEVAGKVKSEYDYYMAPARPGKPEQKLEDFRHAATKVFNAATTERTNAYSNRRCVYRTTVECAYGDKHTVTRDCKDGQVFIRSSATHSPAALPNGGLVWESDTRVKWKTGCKSRQCSTDVSVTAMHTSSYITNAVEDELAAIKKYLREQMGLPL